MAKVVPTLAGLDDREIRGGDMLVNAAGLSKVGSHEFGSFTLPKIL